ncbi:MAG: prolipoprotein diacylglyceryl transferase, partial [Myxococcales bacterium]|nr:prolipoprotein diacylglyceryl transferase [Myxococcales bacterium]
EARCANVEGVWDAAASVCRPAERDCFAWAAFWRGGLAYYGGLLAAGAFGLWFLRKEKFPIGKGIDLVGLVIPLGLFFGRLGCFFGGCCFGTTVDAGAFGAVRFPEWSAASESQWKRGLLSTPGELSLPVHPTQLYESAGCLLIFALGVLLVQPRKRFDGQVMLFFLAGYAVLRFVLEWLRDDDRGAVAGLTTSQWIGVAMMALVVWAWPKLARAARASS